MSTCTLQANSGGSPHQTLHYAARPHHPVRYWVNPYEIMATVPTDAAAALDNYNLRDAKSICVAGCPATADTNATTINWVCNYPDSKDG